MEMRGGGGSRVEKRDERGDKEKERIREREKEKERDRKRERASYIAPAIPQR